ncbi:MAG: FAD-binding protein, partial [Planctomycetota bacterium]
MRRRRRVVLWITFALLALLAAVTARPVFHLTRTAVLDEPTIRPLPPDTVDDASRMNQAKVAEIVALADRATGRDAAERELAALVARARREGLRISIAGSRHTMGGHTIYPGGIALDMRGFNEMVLDEEARILRVGAGAVWSE